MKALRPGRGQGLAALHAAAFEEPWTAEALEALLSAAGVTGFEADGGFILIRVVADEAEILTLAVAPHARRRGFGRALVEAAARGARDLGATRLFLEVAADNAGALALYRNAGFEPVGRRKGYYARKSGRPVDALVLSRPLAPPA